MRAVAELDPAWGDKPSEAPNSIRSLREGADRIEFPLVSIADLGPSEEPDWLLPGYIARSAITLFTGVCKAGKTTFLSHLLRDIYRGSGLVDYPINAKTLILSEEQDGMWAGRRDDLGLSDSILFPVRESFQRPSHSEWRNRVRCITEAVDREGIGLVVYDTLPSLWPVACENDASETLEALTPLRDIAAAGAAVLLIHHPRKSGGSEGRSTRGSGAMPGFADILVELRRYNADDNGDTRRVLTAMGRYADIPAELVIDYGDAGYTFIGGRDEVGAVDREITILEILPTEGEGMTYDDVRAAWPHKRKPGKTGLMGALNRGAVAEKWDRTGRGCKGDPYRFKNRP